MNKIISIVLVLLLILIIFNFSSCGSKKENFSEGSSGDSNIEDLDCITMCELKYGLGTEYDKCIENCGS